MRILFLAPYPHQSADTRYRIEQFLPGLQQAGLQVELRPFMSERLFAIYAGPGHWPEKLGELSKASLRRLADLWAARRYDVVVIHKEAFAFGPPILEALFRRQTGALVFDLDDAFWTHPPQLRQIGRLLRDPHKTEKVLAMSDHIIAGNDYIATRVRSLNPRVSVIPTVIDTRRYQPRPVQRETVTLGWVGRWSSAFYLDLLIPVFQELCARYPQVRIKLIGAGERHWPGVNLICEPWRLEREIEDLHTFDIGLMPLADDDYARYKCGFKMLQYMGLGLPAVVSAVGVNQDVIQDGKNGYLAASLDDWLPKLSDLIENPERRRQLGLAGRQTVEEHYSLARALPLVQGVIEQATHH